MLFCTETYKKSYIESPFPRWRSIKFDVNKDNNIEIFHATLVETLNEKDNWVIQVSGLKAEIVAYLRSKEYTSLIKGKTVSIKTTFTDKVKKNIVIKSLSIEGIVNEHVNSVYNGTINKKDIIDKALNIIKTVDSI